jgi:hypothetical protein
VGRHYWRCFGRPSCFATKANRKQLSTFLRKLSAYTIRPSISHQNTDVVHAWWCFTTFQHYSSRILGQHVPCPMDRSRRTYCVAPTLAWFKSSWFSSLGTRTTLVYATPVNDIVTLRQRVEGGCRTIRNTPGIFERVRQCMARRAQCCVEAHGGHLEHLL